MDGGLEERHELMEDRRDSNRWRSRAARARGAFGRLSEESERLIELVRITNDLTQWTVGLDLNISNGPTNF